MTTRLRGVFSAVALAATVLVTSACTGGTESKAAEEETPSKEAPAARSATDARKELAAIHRAIPVYGGAQYRDDLTRRDEVMIRNKYGQGARVYTLATDDSYPQVFHYYTTYLAQFRGFPARDTYPPENRNWRAVEVQLNQAMQDPFIPGQALDLNGEQVTLQIAETVAEPKTVIRYIVAPRPAAIPVTASASPVVETTGTPVTR